MRRQNLGANDAKPFASTCPDGGGALRLRQRAGPRPVATPGLSGLTALSASNVHALVIGPGNVVDAWGSALRGALGDGIDGSSRTAPGMVSVP